MKRFFPLVFFVFVVFSCKKDFSRQPVVSTGDFDLAMAIAHGTLVDKGTKDIVDHGFCWDSVGEPNLGNPNVRLGPLTTTGSFQAQLTELSANRTYFLKAFISFGDEVLFGAMVTFTTPDLPEITTVAITEITETYAKCGGEITADHGSPVLERGVCWGIDSNPDTTGYHTSDGTGTGVFASVLSGLSPNTQYYVRAYATSIYGTRYANEVEFNTGQSATAPFVSTAAISNITQTTATSGGNVTSDGGAAVTVRGVCWSTSQNPTTSNSHTTDGSGIGAFTSSLTGLTANTTYYVRAYATNSAGTSYGNEKSFTTLQEITLPSVSTAPVTNITTNSATSGGTVTDDGGAFVTARGVCWSTSQNPTLDDPYTTDGTGTGDYVSQITGLSSNTTYYVRAYATNSAGTSYGNQQSFTTLIDPVLPTVTTNDATDITQTTATSGGNVVSDGGATVTVRGVCWSTSSNPTTTDNHTTDGSGIGAFVSYLTGLTPNTLYYVRAYATNSVGTAYGNEVTFTTTPSNPCGGITTVDYGGLIYNTIEIGTQCWLVENLNIGTMISGGQNQTNNSLIEKYCYNNNISNCTEYGGLYQWDEAMQYINIQGSQGLCPPVWHVPDNNDWSTLTNFLGGLSISGGKMKETGYSHWNPPNTGATNESGFTAIASGYRNSNGYFYETLINNKIWSSTESQTGSAWSRNLNNNSAIVDVNNSYKVNGFSIRCIKN